MYAENNRGLFIDWLHIWQVHAPHAPQNSGAIVTYDGGATPIFERARPARVQGSYSTSVAVKSDGETVVFSGNFGRLNRPDNLFNFDPAETLERVNAVASYCGFPLFRLADQRNNRGSPYNIGAPCNSFAGHQQQDRAPLSDIHISRIDLTQNLRTGCISNARAVIRALAAKNLPRIKKGTGGTSSVWWSNTRYMLKAYIKADEMEAHGTNTGPAYEFAKANGIVRFELELKRRTLQELGLNTYSSFLEAWNMGTVHKLFEDYTKPLQGKCEMQSHAELIDSLPQRLRVVAAAFLNGQNVKELMSRATFFRYRKALLEYGIDISDDRPENINIHIRNIELQPIEAPAWYWEQAAA